MTTPDDKLPDCMIGPSEPCAAFQAQTARLASLEARVRELEKWQFDAREYIAGQALEITWLRDQRDSALGRIAGALEDRDRARATLNPGGSNADR